uniref:Odorant binding protein 7 n=1 Tax=Sirex noctilio TaxID=36765 RepID=A0A857N3F9_9HYME|nr:odorant binding protein 7 [Sirex noctilio]
MQRSRQILVFTIVLAFLVCLKADIRRDCRKQTNVSWASLKKLRAGDFNQDDQKLKCYLKCFMVKNNIIDDNSRVETDKALRHLPPKFQESSRRILDRCKNSPGNDSCDTAFQVAKCYFRSQPEILKQIAFV